MESSKEATVADLDYILEFLQTYTPLANLHNTNFITHDYWKLVPSSYQTELEELPLEDRRGLLRKTHRWSAYSKKDKELEQNADLEITTCPSFPEMIQGELTVDKELELQWKHKDLTSFVTSATQCSLENTAFYKISEQHHPSPNIVDDEIFISNSMDEKKSHEVRLMARECASLCHELHTKTVVDIGSGKGYLPSTLSLQHKLNVTGIDSSDGNTQGALKRYHRLSKSYAGLVRREEERAENSGSSRNPKHTRKLRQLEAQIKQAEQQAKEDGSLSLKPDYTPLTCFIKPTDRLTDITGHISDQEKVFISGLHTCGNLAVSSMKLFSNSSNSTGLVNVGCCYHLLDEAFVENPFKLQNPTGEAPIPCFPLSSYLLEKQVRLGRNSRMLSQQAVERSNIGGGEFSERSLFWRALLQRILLDLSGYWSKDWIVGKIAAKCSSFREYVHKALTKLNIPHELSDEDIEDYYARFECHKEKMARFFQLRTCLAPAIESLILLDRALYLLEHGGMQEVYVKRLFDPVKSPRCYAIIAHR